MKKFLAVLTLMMIFMFTLAPAFAEESKSSDPAVEQAAEEEANPIGQKAMAAGICVGIAAAAGAIGMGLTIGKSNESIARQPEAEGAIRGSMMLGLVFIETAIIYALIVAILIIFVL